MDKIEFTAVCLNPCIDMTVKMNKLMIGQLNRIDGARFDYSGKAINAAIVASRLGANSFVTGFMGMQNAEDYIRRLDKEGVRYDFVYYNSPVRTNIKLYETSSGAFTEINAPGEPINSKMAALLTDKVTALCSKAHIIHMSGSMPANCPNTLYADLICIAKSRDKCTVLDSDSTPMKKGLEALPDIIKPNLYELGRIIGKELESTDDIVNAARGIALKGVKWVIVSCGCNGAYLVGKECAFYGKAPQIEALTTTGAGDSMAAAAAMKYVEGEAAADILKAAIAAGSASCMENGTELLRAENYYNLLDKINIEKLD